MTVVLLTILFLSTPFIVILLYQKTSLVKKIGTVIVAYAIGIVAALFITLTPVLTEQDAVSLGKIQDLLMNISIPIAIPLMLFSSDFKLWTKSLPKAVTALITGLVAVAAGVIITFFIFKNKQFTDLPGMAAILTGIYAGGTMNFSQWDKHLRFRKK